MNTAATQQLTAKVFSCPNCGGQLEIRAPGVTVTVFCTHCGSELDAVHDDVRLLQKMNEQLKVQPLLTLGQRGTLQGTTWEPIGFMQRSSSGYRWSEYLLFNPKQGFRWLVENQGHWTLYRTITHKIDTDFENKVALHNKIYKMFDSSTVKVDYALGEFYWRVKKGDTSRVEDFIRPPHILSHEIIKNRAAKNREETNTSNNSGESVWTLGEYIPCTEIANAFKSSRRLPWPLGAGANQPNAAYKTAKELIVYSLLFSFLLAAVMFAIGSSQKAIPHTLLTQTYYSNQKDSNNNSIISGQISPSFTVERDRTVLVFDMDANVNNSWAELQIDLINEDNGNILQLEEGVEYWTGTDNDGAWSEGRGYDKRKLTRIPAGHYHLDVDYTASRSPLTQSSPTRATLTVREAEHSRLLFWLAMLLLFLPPIFALFTGHFFETRRWADSPYNPYQTE